MNIKKIINDYLDYQSKKLSKIQLTAIVAEANIIKAAKTEDPTEQQNALDNALADLRHIKDELAKNDYAPDLEG